MHVDYYRDVSNLPRGKCDGLVAEVVSHDSPVRPAGVEAHVDGVGTCLVQDNRRIHVPSVLDANDDCGGMRALIQNIFILAMIFIKFV